MYQIITKTGRYVGTYLLQYEYIDDKSENFITNTESHILVL